MDSDLDENEHFDFNEFLATYPFVRSQAQANLDGVTYKPFLEVFALAHQNKLCSAPLRPNNYSSLENEGMFLHFLVFVVILPF